MCHDLLNLVGGTRRPAGRPGVLTTAEGIVDELAAAELTLEVELVTERAEQVERVVATPEGDRTAIDTLRAGPPGRRRRSRRAGRGAGVRTARVIPCLDVDAGRVVKGVNFVDLRDAGDPVELAARYDAEGADELVFLDITASSDDRDTMVDVVGRTAEQVFIPFTVGGGIRSGRRRPPDAARRRRQGRVNTAAVERPELVSEIADEFGTQCVVVAIDARGAAPTSRRPAGRCYTHGGRTPTGLDASSGRAGRRASGAGEILLTSMDRDGTRDGYDLELTTAVVDAVNVPVIAERRRRHARPPRRGGHAGRRRRRAGGVDLPLRRAHGRRGQGPHGRRGRTVRP